jgi:hypothetical protein
MRRAAALAAIVALAVVFLFLRKPLEIGTAPVPAASVAAGPPSAGPASTPAASASLATPSARPLARREGILALIPPVERVREELAADPHGHPPSYVAFATDVGRRFDEAVKTREGGVRILHELVDCVESPEARALKPIRSMCLADLDLLADRRPELAERAKAEAVRARAGR